MQPHIRCIPAYAGSPNEKRVDWSSKVYPRLCGGTALLLGSLFVQSIPTCAGESCWPKTLG